MATITYFAALGNMGSLLSFIDGATLTPLPATESAFAFIAHDAAGAGIFVSGTDLKYTNLIPSGGTISEIGFDSTTSTLIDVSGLDVLVADFMMSVQSHNVASLLAFLTGASDTVNGSEISDDLRLAAGAGNDSVYGNAGGDRLGGGAGRDMLNGGIGNDSMAGGMGGDGFVFAMGDGHDLITDFTESTLARSDDKIWVTKAMYDGMQMSETTNSHNVTTVHLTFGAGDVVDVTNWHLVDVSREDFHFYV
jgi:Ca2+-binding RTX toxin-like protein